MGRTVETGLCGASRVYAPQPRWPGKSTSRSRDACSIEELAGRGVSQELLRTTCIEDPMDTVDPTAVVLLTPLATLQEEEAWPPSCMQRGLPAFPGAGLATATITGLWQPSTLTEPLVLTDGPACCRQCTSG
mmetsp:Transcript_67729/g.133681  ORF Transcript_67729/g.133681 Transcript_67729/m.133681 type:complete len:132 (-) Transcript_67729:129-524(-)